MRKKNDFYFVLFGGTIFFMGTLFWVFKQTGLKKNGIYTIGIVQDFSFPKNGTTVYFSYNVDNKNYKSSILVLNAKNFFLGKKVLLRVNKKRPNIVELIEEVENCIFEMPVPKEGWSTLPVCK